MRLRGVLAYFAATEAAAVSISLATSAGCETIATVLDAQADQALRLRALQCAAWLASDQHDFTGAARLFEQSMALSRALQATDDEMNLLINSALQARSMGLYERASTLLDDALNRHRAQGNRGSLSAGGLGFTLYFRALVLREQGDFAHAVRLLNECIALHDELHDLEGVNQGVLGLGDVARDQGNVALMRAYCERSLAVFREFGTQWAIGFTLHNLAYGAYLEGDLTGAMTLVDESIALFRAQRADASLSEVLITRGHILRAQGKWAQAHGVLTESLRLGWMLGPRLMVAAALEALSGVMAGIGDIRPAVRLLGSASALRLRMGTPLRPADRPFIDQTTNAARTELGEAALMAQWMEAESQPLEQILGSMTSAFFGEVTLPQ